MLERCVKRTRDAGMRFAGARFCPSAFEDGRAIRLNPLRRGYTLGFAAVAAPSSSSVALSGLLRGALYEVSVSAELGAAMGVAAEAGARGDCGLLLVHEGCPGALEHLAQVAARAGAGLPKGAGVVVVLRAGGDPEAVAQRLGGVCGTVLVEPVEPADVAQLCWLVPRSQAGASVGRGVEGRRGTPLAKQTKSRISKWSIPGLSACSILVHDMLRGKKCLWSNSGLSRPAASLCACQC